MTNWVCTLCDYYGPEKDHNLHALSIRANLPKDDWAELVETTNAKADLKDLEMQQGLNQRKYRVERNDGTPGKHDKCIYFVLDLTHDAYTKAALEAYANACRNEYPLLAMDLDKL